MSANEKGSPAPSDLPKARIGKRRHFPFIWIVPLFAAVIAAWLVFDRVRREGPLLTILFLGRPGNCPGRPDCAEVSRRARGHGQDRATSSGRETGGGQGAP